MPLKDALFSGGREDSTEIRLAEMESLTVRSQVKFSPQRPSMSSTNKDELEESTEMRRGKSHMHIWGHLTNLLNYSKLKGLKALKITSFILL